MLTRFPFIAFILASEHKISKDIRGIDDSRYGSKDWLLDPIIVL